MTLSFTGLAAVASLLAGQATPVATIATPAPSPIVSAPVMAVVPPAAPNTLKAGTPIALRVLDGLTTKKKKLKVGQRFDLEVADALMVNGVTVIPAGSKAVGEITMVKNKGMWGKRGRLSARALYVRVGERQVRLTGSFDDAGSAGTAGVVGAAVLIPLAGFFVTGTSAEIPSGTRVPAFLDEDLPYIL